MKRVLLLAAVLAVATAAPAAAQWGGVLVTGNEGITTAVERAINSGSDGGAVGIVRGGVISRQGGSDYDPTVSFGLRARGDRLTVDGALDLERMHPDRRMANPDEPVDFRARVGGGLRITDSVTGVGEYSRSFHNETLTGRWMLGVRFGL